MLKVASRRVLIVAGVLLISCGVVTKVGAILATIPDPMIGAQLTISASIVAGVQFILHYLSQYSLYNQVGLSSIQAVDLRLSRNVAILGIACFAGLMIPTYISQHPVWTSSSNKQTTNKK
jgi:nucleobase transporter 1/2